MKLLNLLKENNIIKASPDISLSQALNKLSTSHDAVFVFDKNNHFLGIINPYYHVIKNSYPVNVKIEKCLFKPPKIQINYPLTKVCELFIQSKIHYLPVFDEKNNFLGIISARRILTYLKSLSLFEKMKVNDFIKNKKAPITIDWSDSLSKAVSIFRKERISKLIVVKDNKLKGILSRYDLIRLLNLPKERESRGDKKGLKTKTLEKPVYEYCKTVVLTVNKEDFLNKVVSLIIDKKIGSVIVVNQEKIPISIITTKDLLEFYIEKSKSGFFKKVKKKMTSILSKN